MRLPSKRARRPATGSVSLLRRLRGRLWPAAEIVGLRPLHLGDQPFLEALDLGRQPPLGRVNRANKPSRGQKCGRGTGPASRPAATSPFHSRGVSKRESLAGHRRMAFVRLVFEADAGAPEHRSSAGTPLSENHCCHQSSLGLIRFWLRDVVRLELASKLALDRGDAIGAGHRREAGIRTAGDAPSPPSRRARRGSRRRHPPPRKSQTSLLVVIRTARSGCSIWNAPSRHASQVLAKVWVVVIVSSDSSSSRWLANAASIASKALDSAGSSRARAESAGLGPFRG